MREYIEHRLAVAGHSAHDLFEDGCFAEIYRYSGGVPRLINTLCDTALLCAFAEQKSTLGPTDITSAVEELAWREPDIPGQLAPGVPEVPAPASSSAPFRVEIRADGKQVSTHDLRPGRAASSGRAPDNEIYIKSKFVSRHHAQIAVRRIRSGTIEDLNSTNGTLRRRPARTKYMCCRTATSYRWACTTSASSDLRDAHGDENSGYAMRDSTG
ncbi:MAG: FHA domain-containing protein [Woeseiaceae bacterium]|nr:FHA domain-containing protein [Woeseiaceae bacterium]